ncbi:ABC transporter permease [Salisediminibacterium halotolerans]|uniref:ABC transporter permease subunit n=1 Tax=Salisediminibacterium halotolerans TaxID=517425 RepID=UPI000EABD8BE|nr:ABC transporter permease [Salisediminibacterium halotolerans]RLJ71699.1 ABC-2 type transport system permease protein [Actinophytocola xinjiangensis]RPE86849.1 ABC-2 type transport system permease protein [Salisediminibacterium halotolerans]TWG32912.1 ABC-2 type transport system permease protein [Salisediminibacterium halotolerans]GEL07766.1 ABC transporter permease [Salisediminibacterium halotolerans]
MINLIYNEWIKLVRKKRFYVVGLIVILFIGMFAYAQLVQERNAEERFGSDVAWEEQLEEEIGSLESRLEDTEMPEGFAENFAAQIEQQRVYLEEGVNPNETGAAMFLRMFLDNSGDLFIPLLVVVVTADLVSSERSSGTIKMLLTRPVERWRILLSKYLTMVLSVSLIVLFISLVSIVIAGSLFGFGGWTQPIITDFSLSSAELTMIPHWQYILTAAGLTWFAAVAVGSLTFLLSVLLKGTAAVMGFMLAALISGTILSVFVSNWETAKYLFMVNLNLTNYLSGQPPPVEGMTLLFSIGVLFVWGALATLLAFRRFQTMDML